ncbi:hypothetical protein TRVA0_062S00188 [Trichomonascus vanleenenianus]|uniref:flavin reductase family protein n=1 Tax=Trichomonascus vanleenenianus TaxID=2268995 RepID=UPI003EC995E1
MSSHPDFKQVEASRPDFEPREFRYEKTPQPEWAPGGGATDTEWKKHRKVAIDPYEANRNPGDNYRLLISGIVPRPIGFVSSMSKEGTKNLAPFSYTQFFNHDPPILCIGISGGSGSYKDTCVNILETGECTVNMISEWFVEASNYTATNAPPGCDEWVFSGLTPLESEKVKPPHVAESVFSIECKLVHHHNWYSKQDPSKQTGTMLILEGVNFHVREDTLNEERNRIDIAKYKPISRLGGILYGRTTSALELPRPDFEDEVRMGRIKMKDPNPSSSL